MFNVPTLRSFAAVRPLGHGGLPVSAPPTPLAPAPAAPARLALHGHWVHEDSGIGPTRLVMRWDTQAAE